MTLSPPATELRARIELGERRRIKRALVEGKLGFSKAELIARMTEPDSPSRCSA